MPSRRLLLVVLTSLSCSGSQSGACEGPQDCGGNPCCFRVVDVRELGQSCEPTANGCVPVMGVDTLTTRLCRADGDCTSGGITTTLTHCCQQPGQSFKACSSACLSSSP